MKNAPLLGRLIVLGFVWVFAMAALYVVFEGFGVWQGLPPGLTKAADLATGAVLFLVLVAHLLLASGPVPKTPRT